MANYLLYTQDRAGEGYDVWALSIGGSEQGDAGPSFACLRRCTQSFPQTANSLPSPRTSLDATKCISESFLDPTTRRRVSTSGGSYPRWSRKGNELFFRSLDGQLVAVPVRFKGTSATLEIRGP